MWIKVKPKRNYHLHNSSLSNIPSKLKTKVVKAKGDSAASNHYWALRDTMVLESVTEDNNSTTVTLPDTSCITSIQKGTLPLDNLSSTAKETKIFPNLNHSLISLGQLCDDNCEVILTKEKLTAYKGKHKILEGTRSTSGDGLWDIPISLPQLKPSPLTVPTQKPSFNNINHIKPSLNVILRTNKKSADLAAYLHASAFSPTNDTFIKAIEKKYFLDGRD